MIPLPIFCSTPALEVGMPVFRAIRCFAYVMPNARFHELRPRIGVGFMLMTYAYKLFLYVREENIQKLMRALDIILAMPTIRAMLILYVTSLTIQRLN